MPTSLHIVQVVCTQRHAGVENYVGRISGELTRRGHRVTVITRFPSEEFVPDGVETRNVSHWREAAKVVRSMGDVDVVNSHMTEADAAAALGLYRRNVPLVSTRHFASPRWSTDDGQGRALLRLLRRTRTRQPGKLLSAVHRRIDERIDVEVAVSHFVASHMGRCDRVVLTGVETQRTVPSAGERLPIVVLLQRLEPVKSTWVALDAWARSAAASLGWKLEIHGEGSEREALLQEVSRRSLDNSVSIPGRCNDPETLLRSAGLLLAPAEGDPFPLTVLEAMSFGVPVIASASGGHLESIGQVPGARLFPPGDSSACAEHIDRLLASIDERTLLAGAQRRHQTQHLSIESTSQSLEEIYLDVARSRNRTSS